MCHQIVTLFSVVSFFIRLLYYICQCIEMTVAQVLHVFAVKFYIVIGSYSFSLLFYAKLCSERCSKCYSIEQAIMCLYAYIFFLQISVHIFLCMLPVFANYSRF